MSEVGVISLVVLIVIGVMIGTFAMDVIKVNLSGA